MERLQAASDPQWRRARGRELADGLGYAFSNSSISVYNDVDKTLLAVAGLMESAGIYGAAYRVIDVATMPVYSVFAAAMPRYFRAQGLDGTRTLMQRLLRRTLPLTVLICVGLFFRRGCCRWCWDHRLRSRRRRCGGCE